MRVVILTQFFPPESGAPQVRLSHLAERLVGRGHQVAVLTAYPNYPGGRIFDGYRGLYRVETWHGMQVLRARLFASREPRLLPRLASYASFAANALALGLTRLPRADYLICESPPLPLAMSGALLSRAKRARFILNVSDLWPDSAVRLGLLRPGVALRMAEALERHAYRRAFLITGQTRGIVSDIRRRFPQAPVEWLPNGVDTLRFRPDRRSPSRVLALRGGRSAVAVYAGLHGLAQGLDQVLDAAVQLRSDDLRLVLVGDGPDKRHLVERARTLGLANVEFLPSQPADEIPEILASADVGLVSLRPGFHDAVPTKLYEALGAGLPVVVTSDGEAAELVRAIDAGLVVAPGAPAALADAVRKLASDPELRGRLGTNARAASEARFDRAVVADAFIGRLEAEACAGSH